jgi:hypothetical protein
MGLILRIWLILGATTAVNHDKRPLFSQNLAAATILGNLDTPIPQT